MRILFRAFGLVLGLVLSAQLFALGMQMIFQSKISGVYMGLIRGQVKSDLFGVRTTIGSPFLCIAIGVTVILVLAIVLVHLIFAFIIDDGSPLLRLWAYVGGMIAAVNVLILIVVYGTISSDDFTYAVLTALVLTTASMVMGVAINPFVLSNRARL